MYIIVENNSVLFLSYIFIPWIFPMYYLNVSATKHNGLVSSGIHTFNTILTLCHHMASLGYNKLINSILQEWGFIFKRVDTKRLEVFNIICTVQCHLTQAFYWLLPIQHLLCKCSHVYTAGSCVYLLCILCVQIYSREHALAIMDWGVLLVYLMGDWTAIAGL